MDDLRGRRVLITGAGGFIGANLARELIRQRADVHAFLRPRTDLWRIKQILSQISLHEVDLVHRQMLRKRVKEIKPEYIFHLAVQRRESTPQDRLTTLQTNVMGLFNLLEALQEIDYLGFINAGGSLEYGHRKRAHKEIDRLEPALFYSTTKAAATLICQNYARTDRRPIVTLRLFSVYGYWEAHHRLIPTAIMASLNNQELPLTMPGFRRDLVFVEDVLEACLLAAQTKEACGEIFNIGSGREWTNEQIVETIQSITGKRPHILRGAYPARPSDTSHWKADPHKTMQKLGWRPQHTLERGLEKTVKWFIHHQSLYNERNRKSAR